MKLYLVASVCILGLFGCSADATQAPQAPSSEHPSPSAPVAAPSSPPAVEAPGPQRTEDFPASCVAARFTADGIFMNDATTGLRWYASDFAYQVGPGCGDVVSPTCPADTYHAFPTPTAACGFGGTGLRAATTAEVLALTSAIPGCTLPGLMHSVYAWAPNAKASGPLPIETTDGCVDVKAGVSYAGACELPGNTVIRSTLCVQ